MAAKSLTTCLIVRVILITWMLSGSPFALAQATARLPTVGQLWFVGSEVAHPWEDVFRNRLRELGYVEGQNVRIVARYANGDRNRLPTLLNELIASPVDVLLVSTNAVQVATATTRTIPIVSFSLGNAVRDGSITSLAHPGGNLTGMYSLGEETAAKRLELATELIPGLKRIGVIFEAGDLLRPPRQRRCAPLRVAAA
jgi:putative tryptophan/tyrosine transport system substrate-binding protein